MRAYEFIQKRNIMFYWVFIELRKDDQGHIRKHYINKEEDGYIYPDGKRSPTHFIDNMVLIKKQMEYFHKHHDNLQSIAQEQDWQLALMLDTYKVHQIDVDDEYFEEEFKKLEDMLPFYRSINKKLPHFFFTKNDAIFQGKSFTSYEDGCFDILHGNGALIDPNTPIFNHDKDFYFEGFNEFISQYIIREVKNRRIVDKDNNISYTDTLEKTEIQQLVDLISPDRAVSYKSWISIGIAIKYNNPDDLDVFRSFSQKCPEKYDKIECERKWDELCPDGRITIGTLHYFARNDNPNEYDFYFGKTYNRVKKQFEKTHFKVLHPVAYCEINHFTEEKLIVREENKMFQAYRNIGCYTNDPIKPYQKFFKLWINDEHIRTYEKLTFEPHPFYHRHQENDHVFNTFIHYKVYDLCWNHPYNPVKGEKGLKIFQQQMWYLAGTEKTEKVFDYIRKTIAHIIQKPDEKGIVALLFKSKQGTGKTSFFDYIGMCILGETIYLLSDRYEDLFGTFNPLVRNKVLIAYDEPSGKDTFANADTLKARITGKKVIINKKNISQESVDDRSRYVFLSNNLSPIKKEEDDRRYMCIRCSDEKARNTEYFNELNSVMDFKNHFKNPCKDTLWAVFQWFMDTDISNFDPINDRPDTSYNSNMITLNPILSFCVYLFQQAKNTTQLTYTKIQLHQLYNEWIRQTMPQSKLEHFNSFCKKLREYEDFIQQYGNQLKKVILHYDKMIVSHPHLVRLFALDHDEEETDDEEDGDDD